MSNYPGRFEKVISHIEANLDADLDIDTLCKLAHLSKYHFHRQCSAFMGMSVIKLVRLLRLKRAAYQLAYRDHERVLDIALANGYESHEAFSRVFKKHFNQSPSEFRKAANWTPWHLKYEPILMLRKNIMDNGTKFNVDIKAFPETLIAVMEHRGSPSLLGSSLQKFIEWRKLNHLSPSKSKTFNLVYDDPNVTAPDDYRLDIACSVDKPVAANDYGIVNKVIPAGRCAVIRHIGSDDSIGVIVSFLYTQWLPKSEIEVRDFPIYFERVSFFPDVPENEMITDIYLPIE
ncbi:AraC family transcriptional regulator [Idiomarina abyssalis]|uniref:AraC family transcriptional regulator n=1 Tax=Idiomarina abyssalis TaxID=86102 RepID=A0A8I1KGF9_9GAMM|nr:AraC family transcriptional regulator [Idiomarina abyssalis]MBJ7267843.1 AraC family transcriptional regulator [Idiomarina abyssalis]MBJ7273749.1 AraC family transcriptional regulator [Idiomarina abyssalis]MBJ7314625.1 AraC family transcriptional regulator [Idiomarina abyssalis]